MESNTLDLEQLAFNYEKKCEYFDQLEKHIHFLGKETQRNNF
jgi:hypothetical protein